MSESTELPETMTATRQSFSLLQSRKFLVPTKRVGADADVDVDVDDDNNKRNTLRRLAKLCPSMDLILVKSSNSSSSSSSSSSSLVIYRSLSWQKVAVIALPESLGNTVIIEGGSGSGSNGGGASGSSDSSSLSYCWSPNGQCIAVAQESSVSLYGVESLVTAAGGGGGGTSGSSSNANWTIALLGMGEQQQQRASYGGDYSMTEAASDSNSNNNNNYRNDDTSPVDVLALHWVHVGKHHPTAASPSVLEEEQEVSWR